MKTKTVGPCKIFSIVNFIFIESMTRFSYVNNVADLQQLNVMQHTYPICSKFLYFAEFVEPWDWSYNRIFQ